MMKKKFRKNNRVWSAFSIMALLVLLCAFLGGCGEIANTSYRDNDARKEILIASDIYPPFNFVDENGKSTGIDVDLANEACRRMGMKAVFETINWEDKDTVLKRGEADCLWGSFSMRGREQKYLWAGPYMVSKQVVAVESNSSIKKLADLEGKLICVQTTSKPEEIFMKQAPGTPKVKKIYSMEDMELLYAMLGKGYVDAIAMHESAVLQYNKDYNTDYRVLKEPLLVTGLGVAFAKKDKRGIAERLSKTLEEMRKDGTTRKIVAKYLDEPDRFVEVDGLGK